VEGSSGLSLDFCVTYALACFLPKASDGESQVKERIQGFSLLELMVVVAIILIIAVIAIPRLIRARQASLESSAVANVRTINSVENTYFSSNGGSYGSIPVLITQGFIDARFAATISGYNITVEASGNDYTVSATPVSVNSGRFGYYSTPDAVIRFQTATSATCTPCFPGGLSGAPVQ
jgi:prepilin-type N-terminal cleavage/methylation domain-containing protein